MSLGPLLLLAAATLLLALLLAIDTALGLRSLPRLEDAPPAHGGDGAARGGPPPRVSIVVAARDEERHIAAAVDTLLRQDYPDHEVVAVDDRSTDRTTAILRRAAAARAAGGPALRVVRVDTLPAGWLGKNHALHLGAAAATGDLILFADADVMLAPDALARAVGLMRRDGLDHLAVAPRMHVGGPWAAMAVAVFLVVFSVVFRPWKARDPKSRHHIGIGAFNLVRADAYRAVGGHRSIALRPDDDVRLGRLLKAAGSRQAAALGRDLVQVEWYPSLRAMALGLRKNSFAVVEYRISLVALGTLVPIALVFWPAAAVALTTGATRWLNLAVLAAGAVGTWDAARQHRLPWWTGPTHVVGSGLILWIVWAAALAAVRTGRVEWRGTSYSLAELRAGAAAGSGAAEAGSATGTGAASNAGSVDPPPRSAR